jgi:hypothetical protein
MTHVKALLISLGVALAVVGATAAAEPTTAPAKQPRKISINGRAASAADLKVIQQLEQQSGGTVPDGAYWYDAKSGAAGVWGGPMTALIPADLALGPAMPANASGGGEGKTTGVFINGREIHAADAQGLKQLLGDVQRGRWSVDARGNVAREGGPTLFNVYDLMQQRQARSGGKSQYRTDGRGNNVFIGNRCVAVNGSKSTENGTVTTSYYSGCD